MYVPGLPYAVLGAGPPASCVSTVMVWQDCWVSLTLLCRASGYLTCCTWPLCCFRGRLWRFLSSDLAALDRPCRLTEVALRMLRDRNTLLWRREARPGAITWQDVERAGRHGRIEVAGDRDLLGRPIIFYQLKCAALVPCMQPPLPYVKSRSACALQALVMPPATAHDLKACMHPWAPGGPWPPAAWSSSCSSGSTTWRRRVRWPTTQVQHALCVLLPGRMPAAYHIKLKSACMHTASWTASHAHTRCPPAQPKSACMHARMHEVHPRRMPAVRHIDCPMHASMHARMHAQV
jgi:hypothetical protein